MIRGFLLAVVRSPLFYLTSLLVVVVIYFSATNP